MRAQGLGVDLLGGRQKLPVVGAEGGPWGLWASLWGWAGARKCREAREEAVTRPGWWPWGWPAASDHGCRAGLIKSRGFVSRHCVCSVGEGGERLFSRSRTHCRAAMCTPRRPPIRSHWVRCPMTQPPCAELPAHQDLARLSLTVGCMTPCPRPVCTLAFGVKAGWVGLC